MIDNLDLATAYEYWNAIDVLEAGEVLLEFTTNDYPHLNDKSRKDLFKKFESKLKPVRKSEGKKLTNKELMELLARR